MKNIYCISGLGADQRIFQKLKVPGVKFVFLDWPPFDKHDDLACYAQKLFHSIKETNPTILGVSFGGMLTVEIAKQYPIKQAFIVSSTKTVLGIPPVGKFLSFLIKMKVIPVGLFKNASGKMFNLFGAKTEEEKKLLHAILKDTDNKFLQWSMKAILAWNSTEAPAHVTHIHGTNDLIIPSVLANPDIWISGGTHMMIYSCADTVSFHIKEHLMK